MKTEKELHRIIVGAAMAAPHVNDRLGREVANKLIAALNVMLAVADLPCPFARSANELLKTTKQISDDDIEEFIAKIAKESGDFVESLKRDAGDNAEVKEKPDEHKGS